ncbi:MAG: ATP phosphoribosyltransferase regulatory subunit [Deltaproteobacteria bacterium]|nr:ATP phosphoribosyltransferase regulatory subunit [Deltaproteobacteria bacterium]
MRDVLPERTAKRNALIRNIVSVFEGCDYREVTTPFLEYLDVITQGAGKDLKKRVVKFTDRATGRSLSLRPDFTPQIARIVATHYREKKKPVRLSYHGSVIRLAEDASGGQKELYQAGVELIGAPSPDADAEVISLAIELLKASGLNDFKIAIGQVDFVRGILDEADLSQSDRAKVLDAISKRDSTLLNEMSTTLTHGDLLIPFQTLLYLFGGEDVLYRRDEKKLITNQRSRDALDNIRTVYESLKHKNLSNYVSVDLCEIRGFDYHTGIIFEGFVNGVGSAICGGGRYDNLLASFGYPSPATGFAIDLDILMLAIERQG